MDDAAAGTPCPAITHRFAGHESLANLVQGTVCKILAQEEVKPQQGVRYYLERRDAEFEQKRFCAFIARSRS